MTTFTDYFVAICSIGLVITGVLLFIGDLSNNYNINYDNSSSTSFDKIKELSSYSQNISNQTQSLNQNPTISDVLGGYFVQGYNVVRTTFASISIGSAIISDSITNLNLGTYQTIFVPYLTLMLVFAVIIGIIVSAIVRWNL